MGGDDHVVAPDAINRAAVGVDCQTQLQCIETAPYVEANYDVTDHWRVTAGIRSTRIQTRTVPIDGDGIANGGPTTVPLATLTDTTTPKLSLQYRFTPDDQIYATAAKGFRPGLASGGEVPDSLCGADLAKLGCNYGQRPDRSGATRYGLEL